MREVFGKGNDFAAKITYTAKDAKGQLQAFRTSPSLRIAVTVDMIATGTDVKPLECVFFMRDVRSAQYFEQMKGRGARTIPAADFQAVTPDAEAKTRFVIVDAVGVTEHDFVDPPLNRDKSVPLKKLLDKAAALTLTEDETATLASRLAKLELELTPEERAELDTVAGTPVRDIVRAPGRRRRPRRPGQGGRRRRRPGRGRPGPARPRRRAGGRQPRAAQPHPRAARHPRPRHRRGHHRRPPRRPRRRRHLPRPQHRRVLEGLPRRAPRRDHRHPGPHRGQGPAHRPSPTSRALADRIARPPYNWTPDIIWAAYEAVDIGRVRHSDRHTLTDLVSLLRYTVGADDELVPYADRVRERYAAWLAQQEQAGVTFSEAERWWLDRMVDVIASSAGITPDDLDERALHRTRRHRRCAPRPRRPQPPSCYTRWTPRLLDEFSARLGGICAHCAK